MYIDDCYLVCKGGDTYMTMKNFAVLATVFMITFFTLVGGTVFAQTTSPSPTTTMSDDDDATTPQSAPSTGYGTLAN